ncbi:MAG: hypothetical protein H6581_31755 [Bacteroidia bacterium]|nr:hypothetical protein [Bacteroidia bacterium]MCB9236267.1 hypothetical protein [Bacteroidia bacterium]
MAELKGIFPIKGTIDGYVFYELNGKLVVRRKPQTSKKKIMTHPNFQKTRENMSEFGASTKMGKSIRAGWNTARTTFFDSTTASRLTGLIRKNIVAYGPGEKGTRLLSLACNPLGLRSFPFTKKNLFEDIFFAPYTLTSNPERTAVTLEIPELGHGYLPQDSMKAPSGATHYRLWLLASTISDFAFDPASNQYHPLHPDQSEISAPDRTEYLSLQDATRFPLTMSVSLPQLDTLPPGVSLIACLGLEFATLRHNEFDPMVQNRTMKIAAIFP